MTKNRKAAAAAATGKNGDNGATRLPPAFPARPETLFMDRDGVVNRQIVGGYVQTTGQFVLLDGFIEAMKILRTRFRRLILVTNQQGIGKGVCTRDAVEGVHRHLQGLLREAGAPFDAIYCCPHLASLGCGCRKPATGMALQARHDFPDIDFDTSVMAGDSLTDMQFARNAGMTAIHVGSMPDNDFDEIMKIALAHYDSLYDFALNCRP